MIRIARPYMIPPNRQLETASERLIRDMIGHARKFEPEKLTQEASPAKYAHAMDFLTGGSRLAVFLQENGVHPKVAQYVHRALTREKGVRLLTLAKNEYEGIAPEEEEQYWQSVEKAAALSKDLETAIGLRLKKELERHFSEHPQRGKMVEYCSDMFSNPLANIASSALSALKLMKQKGAKTPSPQN